MVRINWTSTAVNDLREIYEYISRDSKKYARFQIVKIRARVKILVKTPLAGRVVPELMDKKFRELIEGNYRVVYKIVDDERVDIVTVHHSAMDFENAALE